jgi:hypothetical protein
MNATSRGLEIIGRSPTGQVRTLRVRATAPAQHNAAYRRLAATILGLDVASLAHQLRVRQLSRPPNMERAA